jgi:hypothetical protein
VGEAVNNRSPMVTIELQLRPSPPADARPYWWGYGMLSFYQLVPVEHPPHVAEHRGHETRPLKVWEADLHELTARSTWSAKVEHRDGFGWVLVLRLLHDKARAALAALNLPENVTVPAGDTGEEVTP